MKINDGKTSVNLLFKQINCCSQRINKFILLFLYEKSFVTFNCIFEPVYHLIFNENKTNGNSYTKIFSTTFIQDLQMIKRKIYFILTTLFLSFYCLPSLAQDSVVSRPVVEGIRTNGNKQHYLKAPALIIPGTFLIYGGLRPAINDISKLDNRIMRHMQARYPTEPFNAADYLMWVPSASVYAMDAFKVKTAHKFKQHLLLDAGSIAITGSLGLGMRIISRNIKSFNTDNTEFPSGHTANAFRGAEILHQELKQNHNLLSYSGYVVATAVGFCRIYGKEHYFSQVVAGAGLGIISTKLTYWIFDKIKNSKDTKEKVGY